MDQGGDGRVTQCIPAQCLKWVQLHIHAVNPMLVWLIPVWERCPRLYGHFMFKTYTKLILFVIYMYLKIGYYVAKINSPAVAYHDDVIKWKHFPPYWPFVRRIHRSPVNSPHKGQWGGPFIFSLICVWINGWVNNREAGDLRRYRAHYDVSVMFSDKV